MSQTKRKPGEVAPSAELGSHNPAKENGMNKPTDTTSIPNVKASDAAIVKAMKEMETDLHVLFHMSDIMANKLDELLLSQSCRVKTPDCRDCVTIRLTDHEVAQASFLFNAVAERSALLSKRFAAAWNGEVLA